MVLRPPPKLISDALGWALICVTAPAWVPLVALIYLMIKAEEGWQKLTAWPLGWNRWFAWHPVECSPWPDPVGFRGYVWLETVWRNPNPEGFVRCRREPPSVGSD